MHKNVVFSFLIFACLCLGQGTAPTLNSDASLPLSRSIYMKSFTLARNSPLTEKLFSAPDNSSSSNSYVLVSQVEGEDLLPRSSFWKRTGIFGLELIGSGMIAVPCALVPLIILREDYRWSYLPLAISIYLGGNITGGSTATWAIGKLLKQDGKWIKACAGSSIGVLVGTITLLTIGGTENDWICLPIYIASPALGSVVVYNF